VLIAQNIFVHVALPSLLRRRRRVVPMGCTLLLLMMMTMIVCSIQCSMYVDDVVCVNAQVCRRDLPAHLFLWPQLQMQDESQKREHLLSMGTNPDERAPRPKKRKKKYPASGKCNYTDVLPTLIVAVLYFCTYSLPALIPIIIHRFHNYKSLYILVNFGYTVGDFMGRMVTVLPCIPGWCVAVDVLQSPPPRTAHMDPGCDS